MSNVPKSKRKPSGFQVVDTAIKIYDRTLGICLRMPNRYTYLVLQPILTLAGDVMDNVKKGNSVIPNARSPDPDDVRLRRLYFQKAYASLQALITRMNFFLARPDVCRHKVNGREIGITQAELGELANYMIEELKTLKGVMAKDKERYKVSGNA